MMRFGKSGTVRIWLMSFICGITAIYTSAVPDTAFARQRVTDAQGRVLTLPPRVDRIICSGAGALRLATYLNARDRVVAVDDLEVRGSRFDARPYALAGPGYKHLPVFGGFRGRDDPEQILGLSPLPQVIFKTHAGMGHDPMELQAKTGIPVVILEYGDLGRGRQKLFASLRTMGGALGLSHRAEAVIRFFSSHITDLHNRTQGIKQEKTCFVGGIAFKGPHGFQSTEPFYPPFQFVNARNIASQGLHGNKTVRNTSFSKEKILTADPDILFLDLSTLQMGEGHGGLFELKTDPVFQALTAVSQGEVYGLLPYNWYTRNFGSVLADAWYIGSVLYPKAFADIDPKDKADEIYQFLLGEPLFDRMNQKFKNLAFTRLKI